MVTFPFGFYGNISLGLMFGSLNPAGFYLFKVSNRNTRTRCELCSKLKMKTQERNEWRHSDVVNVNFEHISRLELLFLLVTLSR